MYYFYMGSVLLPIPPESFSLKIKNTNKTVTLINEGEINILKEAGLTDLEFKVLIPAVEYSFATYEGGFKPQSYFLTHFENLKTEKEPFQLIVSRKMSNGKLLFDTNMTVSLEDYQINEKSNEGFDLVVSIKLKQYRLYGTKIVKVDNNVASVENQREQSKSPAPKQDTTYTVKSGDCLWNIAKEFYGNGSKYTKIYEANKDKITNPNLIYPGQTLIIPNASSTAPKTEPVKTQKEPVKTQTVSKPVNVKTYFLGITAISGHSYAGTINISYIKHGKTEMMSSEKTAIGVSADENTTVTVTIVPAEGHSFEVVYLTGTWTDKRNVYTVRMTKDCKMQLKWVE